MTEKNEALRLADALEMSSNHGIRRDAAAELRRLHADAEESEALRERLSALLRNTAIALRGPEPELTRWSWHDLPELATALKAQRDALAEPVQGPEPPPEAQTEAEKVAYCAGWWAALEAERKELLRISEKQQ